MRLAILFLIISLLTACGGSDASSETSVPAPPPVVTPPVAPPALSCEQERVSIASLHQQSAYTGNDAHVIQGVIHANFTQPGSLQGFYVQTLDDEWDEASEHPQGIFVRFNSPLDHSVIGQAVALKGTWNRVSDQVEKTLTENMVVCALSSTIRVTNLQLPVEHINELTVLQGVSVRVEQPMLVTNLFQLARFGEVELATELLWQPTEFITPGNEAESYSLRYDRKRFILTDAMSLENPDKVPYPAPELSFQNTLRIGDEVRDLRGAFTFQQGRFRLHPTVEPQFLSVNPRPQTTSLPGTGDLVVASVNLWDYFPSELNDFERQRPKVVNALSAMNADVYGVQELFNDGFGPASAVQDLVDALNQAESGSPYAFVDFGAEIIGSANITNGIIYRRDRVRQVGTPAFLDSGSFAFRTHRPPVAQTFELLTNGAQFTLTSNHLRSRNCGDSSDRFKDHLDGQGCASVARKEAMQDMLPWLLSEPTGVRNVPVIVVGDFNSYRLEDPARLMREAGFVNSAELSERDEYSYTFQGQLGSLDYVFFSNTIEHAITGVEAWRINADEPVALNFSRRFKNSRQQTLWYSEEKYRMSDHNPIVVEFDTGLWP